MSEMKVYVGEHFFYVEEQLTEKLQKELDDLIFLCKMLSYKIVLNESGNIIHLTVKKDKDFILYIDFVISETLYHVLLKAKYIFNVEYVAVNKDFYNEFNKNKDVICKTNSMLVKENHEHVIQFIQALKQDIIHK